MAQITGLSVLDTVNAITIRRINLADLIYSRADYSTWLAAHPGATATQVEAGIQAVIATKWPNAPVNVFVHVIDLNVPNLAVRIADVSEPAPPANWWTMP